MRQALLRQITVLQPGSSCVITVAFSPQVIGYMAAVLNISVDSPGSPQAVFLTGTGISFATSQFAIVNKLSSKTLDVTGFSKLNGAPIQQWDYWGGDTQKWQLIPVNGQSYKIASILSQKVLDVTGYSTNNGAIIQQWDYLGTDNQLWELLPLDSTFYEIANKLSGKVLDDTGLSMSNGTVIQQWEYLGGDNQKWQLVPITVPSQ